MVRKLTFGRWGDIAGKMHTFGRWGILFSLGMSVRVVFRSGAGGSIKKTAAGVLRSVVLGNFIERKTGFEPATFGLGSRRSTN